MNPIKVTHLILFAVLLAAPAHAQDAPFKVALGSYAALSAADVAGSAQFFQVHPRATEAMLGGGLEAQPLAFGAMKAGIATGTVFALRRLHQDKPKLAWALAIFGNVIEAAMVARTVRLGGKQ